ncbi:MULTISPECIES: DUF2953 domain-containing protein [Clostridium]|uniref:DUF2953 domain-containing protein n=4 Tax=Clostridium TaxID=1485 RepID=D8GRL3_CLOLD|nr:MULTISPECIES: DUF2953 domain-containing protein [Clostridium]ADK16381.1 conserved hypothetical protein [Clostridium ljungdahlii DSM 13528]AGY75460.1 DUF2953 domain-containing protein [Clostridium autoethanogenum DSM 10061]ALU35626.1 Hypothetical protein CLAU_1197 [Clostridium autoethanogenum DSM 10061]OAA89743.1 hypothetical protein WX45_01580 [Clostridium ljungdahlii DSM 13528]OAA94635.1 hypothetical protein WX73_02347 [Clostridium coskatii]
MIILKVMGSIILILIILLIFLLISNVTYRGKSTFEENNIIYNFEIGLFFNIISIILKGSNSDSHLSVRILCFTKKSNINSKKDKIQDESTYKFSHIIQGVKKLYEYKDSIIKIISIIKPKYVKIEGNYGFDDPSMTGMLCGVFNVIYSFLPKNSIRVIPDFFNEVFNLHLEVSGKCRIILIVITLFKVFHISCIKKEISY